MTQEWGIHMRNILLYVVGIAVLLGGAYFLFFAEVSEVFAEDLVLTENHVIDTSITLQNGARILASGDLDIRDTIECDGGPITIIAEGAVTISGELDCEDADAAEDASLNRGITIVAKGGLKITPAAEISASGNIQFVSDESELLTSNDEIEARFRDIALPTGGNVRIGPFIGDGVAAEVNGTFSILDTANEALHFFAPKTAHAQAGAPVVIGGKMTVATPPKGVKRLVIFVFPGASEVTIADFELTGPDGRDGDGDKNANCSAKGKDGEDAFRFNAVAPNLKVNNFTLNLGNGGAGGEAETPKECKPGRAEGGKGGSSGNFKMIGSQSFEILGTFLINPGIGGAGGGATAKGKDGGPSEDGGDATAIGGRGAENKKVLSVAGTVSGMASVEVGDLIGGDGGSTLTEPGTGGNGAGCGKNGGKGGSGTATGGKGGDAKLTLGGASRAALAKDIGGRGGHAESSGAKGGEGGDCDPSGPGGNGGAGGKATATEGKGGLGSTGPQSDGSVLDETGGDGGNGGDGCGPGKGGKGGAGDPPGKDGADGKNLCVAEEKQTGVQVTPPTSASEKIRVIQYGGKYLPVDQLIIESEQGCDGGQAHWHAARGVVIATDGSQVSDPGPQCGYGKTRDVPVMEIAKPKTQSGGTIKVCGLPGGEPCPEY